MNDAAFLIVLAAFVVVGLVAWRAPKDQRPRIGAAASGALQDFLHEDKRRAIEVIVTEKAGARDHETADDDGPPEPPEWAKRSVDRVIE